ncbi:EAL domain-containing protein [Vibrio sp. JC009]|uniref:putative bifunctional diguanylate cyclase/phosphodiesterase n=1 Tax=Vibrio sp. JC009 TaxID=2912314 RepID=UPI0023B050AD|nr:EAL domain-containing protein [Vibrio sp. JC009]WED20843.1 EAL domain-containing protein [Vibrio sp. JC009]
MRLVFRGHSARAFSFASLLIVMMGFLFYLGNDLLVKRVSLIEVAEEIKVDTSTAHLWFEEILSGDTSENIADVWNYLDRAQSHADALLTGGEVDGSSFSRIESITSRQTVVQIKNELAEFRTIAEIRYAKRQSAFAGTLLDEQFDTQFFRLNATIDRLEERIKQELNSDIFRFQVISVLLICISTIGAAFLFRFLNRQEANQDNLLESLTKANKQIEEKNKNLHYQAHFDLLTGLPNRALLLDRLEQARLHAERAEHKLAVLFIDLDHFKEVNDRFGHHTGDTLLKMVAKRIQNTIRATDTAARISGDEFMVVLEGMVDSVSSVRVTNKIAETLIESLSNTYQIDDKSVHVSASIGIAIYPDDTRCEEELVRFADNAMYYAKSRGKNNYQFYSKELNQRSMEQADLEGDLRVAIDNDQFVLHYQPRWTFASGEVSGIEALVRWNHPEKGLLYPADFIPTAEYLGLIHEIDLLVTQKVLNQQKIWHEKQIKSVVVSVNISPYSFKQKSFLQSLCSVISDSDVGARDLEIEIKEQVLTEDKYFHNAFSRFKKLGLRLSLDDFGTDSISLKHLKSYPFNTLKIDKSYTSDQMRSKTTAILLENIVKIAGELGIEVVAEGIETMEQKDRLRAMGCKVGQGYMLAEPMEVSVLESYFAKGKKGNIIEFKRS